VAQWKGGAVRSRVAGTDLMKAFFFGTQGLGFRHYFYGDTDHTLVRLTGNLTQQYPGLTVAGAYSPPFRPLTEEEDEAAIRRINEAKPDVLWVGLGLPKQEQWIYTHRAGGCAVGARRRRRIQVSGGRCSARRLGR
jgi:exopolysaccharide biosynthesis WecB/TagA/CpsF family protein